MGPSWGPIGPSWGGLGGLLGRLGARESRQGANAKSMKNPRSINEFGFSTARRTKCSHYGRAAPRPCCHYGPGCSARLGGHAPRQLRALQAAAGHWPGISAAPPRGACQPGGRSGAERCAAGAHCTRCLLGPGPRLAGAAGPATGACWSRQRRRGGGFCWILLAIQLYPKHESTADD